MIRTSVQKKAVVSTSLSTGLASFVQKAEWGNIPRDLQLQTRWRILDTLGLCLAGSVEPFAVPVLRVASRQGGRREATAIGVAKKIPAAMAALVAGTLAHGLDFDDTHIESVVHLSSTVVPTALAAGEATGSPAREVLGSIAAGCEAMSRLGAAAGKRFHERGFHASGVVGPVAAALVAGKLYRLALDEMVSAAGVAGSFGGGVLEFLSDGTWSKRLHPGWAAHAGIIAAQLAAEGFLGPATILEGKQGLYWSHLGEAAAWKRLSYGLGAKWESRHSAFKLFPCAHVIHPFLEALLAARNEHELSASQVKSVLCQVAPWMVPLVCEPRPGKIAPATEYQARTSLPFAAALALADGKIDPSAFSTDSIKRQEIRSLAARIECCAVPEKEREGFQARVRLVLMNGKQITAERTENPGVLPQERLKSKFLLNANRVLSRSRAMRLMTMVLAWDGRSKVSALLEACRA